MNELYDKLNEIALRDAEITEIELHKPMNTKEQWEENLLLILAVRNEQVYKDVWSFIKEIKEQAKKEERERIKDKIGNIFNCLSDIDEYTDKMAIERMFKIWESL